ncbi:gliding motility-associated peptidyl-prolyl isomerase GldI [Myroides pelagicus]|uniref:Peptidyl-prolyl cis-trans isomerase n=1 Tax=Myroides pelagicus TaxID=270914 RepID=A0A7K1GL93_9FLAO|nr:gliding motility-associated peptidyl-prolyl isomerase GldI [Myroides pelagicus]MEC4114259.1 gliding motility-associated peptidyl-prolyl isomerase GldI [Myroides pelagicus]MTH29309.1 gliding motility-associated peptidyl-prolyl isomerase GldI [Myroides pelagicus]
MMNYLKFYCGIILLISIAGCGQKEEARRPISEKRNSVLVNSVERNQTQLENEESLLSEYMKKNDQQSFLNSQNGFWYSYSKRLVKDSISPKTNDQVTFTYEVSNLKDSLIYSKSDIGLLTYIIEKEELLPVLRQSLKLMKQHEVIKVLTPSSLAYSYMGDKNKIHKNQPLIFTIELIKIEKQKYETYE